jgi:putative transposase
MAIPSNLLKFNSYYHIYNRGINSSPLFLKDSNYERFIMLMKKYLPTVTDCYAWVLMKNHFHFVLKTKAREDISKWQREYGFKQIEEKYRLYQQLSNLFNAYVKYFNLLNERTGSLFENRFKRRELKSMDDVKNVISYIHNNPIKHRIVEHPLEYPWSSYLSCRNANMEKRFIDITKNLIESSSESYSKQESFNIKKTKLFYVTY